MTASSIRPVASTRLDEPPLPPLATKPLYFIVSACAYRFVWLGIVAVYSFVALYLVLQVYLYSVTYAQPAFGYFVTTFRLLPVNAVVIKAFQALALLYLFSLVRILYDHPFGSKSATTEQTSHPVLKQENALSTVIRTARRAYDVVASTISIPGRYWGVHSVFFDVATLTREAVEIAMQSVQAYRCSLMTYNAVLNLTYGLLIPLNCFSSPLIHFLLRNGGVPRERVVVLVVDLVLDLVWLALPLIPMTTYFQALLGSEVVLIRDTFTTRALTELPMVIVTSYGDLLMKITPAISVWLTVNNIKKLVRPASSKSPHPVTFGPATTAPHPATTHIPKTLSRLSRIGWFHSKVTMTLEWALVVWGCVVAVVYLAVLVTPVQCESGCRLILRPWFTASECYCAVQRIDCHSRGISGSEDEIRDALLRLNTKGMASLIFTHCPQLHIPDTLRRYSHLFSLEIFNSTIVSWSPAAMIDGRIFPQLGFVYLILTGVADVPDALLGPHLPATLHEVAIIGSNLTRLPPSVVTDWRSVRTLYLDRGNLEIFPTELGQLQLDTISLDYNRIASIPDDALATSSLGFLALNLNPLTRLPKQIGSSKNLCHVQIQFSNISSLTDVPWLATDSVAQQFMLLAHGTPLCMEGQRLALPDFVVCSLQASLYRGFQGLSYYNLEGKIAERAIVSPLAPEENAPWT